MSFHRELSKLVNKNPWRGFEVLLLILVIFSFSFIAFNFFSFFNQIPIPK